MFDPRDDARDRDQREDGRARVYDERDREYDPREGARLYVVLMEHERITDSLGRGEPTAFVRLKPWPSGARGLRPNTRAVVEASRLLVEVARRHALCAPVVAIPACMLTSVTEVT